MPSCLQCPTWIAYLPALVTLITGVALVGLVRRGPPLTRVTIVVLALLPVHGAVVCVRASDVACPLMSGLYEPCIRDVDHPVVLLMMHAVLVATGLVALLAWAVTEPWRTDASTR